MNEIQEPVLTWSLFFTAIIIPIGLWVLFASIKRLLAKRDKEDIKKDEIIAELVRSKECANRRELEFSHNSITLQIDNLRKSTEETNRVLFDKLEGIYSQLKFANGRTGKLETAFHVLKAVHDDKHRRRSTDYDDECEEYVRK